VNRRVRVQLAFMIMASVALPGAARAVDLPHNSGPCPQGKCDPWTIAKRAGAFAPQMLAERLRSMDVAFPSHVIKRDGPVAELSRADRKLDVTYTFAGKQHTLEDLLARSRTQGFLVIKDGKIVCERYFNGANDKSRFTSFSVAKSFTSTLVGLALADGRIKTLDDPVTNYLPELKGSGYNGVPIKDLLEMSSGVKFDEVYNKTESDVSIMWSKTMEEESETFADYAMSVGRAEQPGTKFVYRSVDSGVLGMLVRRVTGESLADMLSRRIWQPLGMESDATWLTDHPGPGGLEAAYCCINARLRDYGRFGVMFLNQGKAGGKQVVPSWWVEQATTPQGPQVSWGHLYPNFAGGYGYQWWLNQPGQQHSYAAVGIFFQFIHVMPKYNTVIVKASADDDFSNVPLAIEQFTAFEAIGRALETARP
jgi:CubicO group peptidase (beta-lactamase class C family)